MKVEGCIKTNLKLGEIDDDIKALVVLGLQSMKKYKLCLIFGWDRLWTGLKKGTEVPVRYATPKLVPRQLPTVPPDSGGQTEPNSITDSQLRERPTHECLKNCGSIDELPESSSGNYENQCVRVVQEEDEKIKADWATDDEVDTSEVYPAVVSLEEALRRCTPTGKSDRLPGLTRQR